MPTVESELYLIALYQLSDGSLKAKFPIHAVVCRTKNKDKKYAKYQLKKLRNEGMVRIFPHGTTVYSLQKA